MTASAQKILGRFVYQADAIPKGSRSARRIDLWAPAEFEMATAAPDDIASDAIVVQPRMDRAGHAGAIPLSLAAYRGLLWSPMKPLQEGGQMHNLAHLPSLTVDDYLAQSRGEFTPAWSSDDPILASYDSLLSAESHALPVAGTMLEDDFAGRILWSNRTEALRRHAAAARDVLFVGSHVYARRPEPTWSIAEDNYSFNGPVTGKGGVVLTGLTNYNSLQRFRLDRLEDAIKWRDIFNPKVSKTVHGTIVHADFSLLHRDDLACMIFDTLSVLHGQATMALPYSSAEGLASWRALSDFVRSVPSATFLEDRIEIPANEAARHLSALVRELESPALPRHLEKPVAEGAEGDPPAAGARRIRAEARAKSAHFLRR